MILTDDLTAIMNDKDFADLPEYSYTDPTRLSLGKRWKRHILYNAQKIDKWFLCEVVPDPRDEDGYVGIKHREIILV